MIHQVLSDSLKRHEPQRTPQSTMYSTIYQVLLTHHVTGGCSNTSYVERGSSAVEHRPLNRESLGSNPLSCHIKVWAFVFSPRCPSSLSWLNESLSVDSGGHVGEEPLRSHCSMDWMLPREAELVLEWTCLSGRATSVRRFERTNGLDTTLYKNKSFLAHPLVAVVGSPGSSNLSLFWLRGWERAPVTPGFLLTPGLTPEWPGLDIRMNSLICRNFSADWNKQIVSSKHLKWC